jgi:hypothetical protein
MVLWTMVQKYFSGVGYFMKLPEKPEKDIFLTKTDIFSANRDKLKKGV